MSRCQDTTLGRVESKGRLGGDGARLYSQRSRGRGEWSSANSRPASLVYRGSSPTAEVTKIDPVSKKEEEEEEERKGKSQRKKREARDKARPVITLSGKLRQETHKLRPPGL